MFCCIPFLFPWFPVILITFSSSSPDDPQMPFFWFQSLAYLAKQSSRPLNTQSICLHFRLAICWPMGFYGDFFCCCSQFWGDILPIGYFWSMLGILWYSFSVSWCQLEDRFDGDVKSSWFNMSGNQRWNIQQSPFLKTRECRYEQMNEKPILNILWKTLAIKLRI